MAQHLLLTGATGLVGQYLLRDLLLAGMPVAVLARPRGGDDPRTRVGRLLARWEGELGCRLSSPPCLEGDVTADSLGLSPETLRWAARHCDRVLHCAASLTFRSAGCSREPWLTNLTGMANVLAFCRRAELRQLHHVSTAYVCGNRPGPVREDDLDHGQEFRNDYERSKFEAEGLVRSADFLDRLTVYRPAVVVGDSRTGYTSTYHGLYAYLHFVWVLSRHADRESDGRWHLPVRLSLAGDEPRNLVPVDWVSAVIAHLVLSPEHHGRTYHLAPVRPATAQAIEEALAGYFGYHGPIFAGPGRLVGSDLNQLERLFYEHVALYEPYWAGEPVFDCSNTRAAAPHLPCPAIDGPMLRRLIDHAVRDGWGKCRRPRASP